MLIKKSGTIISEAIVYRLYHSRQKRKVCHETKINDYPVHLRPSQPPSETYAERTQAAYLVIHSASPAKNPIWSNSCCNRNIGRPCTVAGDPDIQRTNRNPTPSAITAPATSSDDAW
jgi:hypothetical protein